MNPSGSEFTLRVAICDLVERLKRMQHKCTYLEECRNQLVKEVIRLRLQNEWLAKQISDSPGASASLPTQQHLPQGGVGGGHGCFCGQQQTNQQQLQIHQLPHQPSLVNSQYHTPHCHLGGGGAHEPNSANDSSGSGGGLHSTRDVEHLLCMNHHHHHNNKQHSTGSSSSQKADESLHLMNILSQFEAEDLDNKQDSIKNLTIQMLKDLETEMKTGRLKSDLIQFVKHSQGPNGADGVLFTEKAPTSDDLMKFDDDEVMMMVESNTGNTTTTKLTTTVGSHGNTPSANYEAFNNNSDYYSNSHNLNIAAFEDLQMQMYEQNANNNNSNRSNNYNHNNKDGADSLLNQSTTTRGRAGGMMATELSLLDEDNPTIKVGTGGGKLSEGNNLKSLKDEEVIGILSAVKNDLKNLQAGVLASTDKLHKIKSRQLRYYFQKQINLDSAGGGGGGGGGKNSKSSQQQQQSIPIPSNNNAFGGSSNSSLK